MPGARPPPLRRRLPRPRRGTLQPVAVAPAPPPRWPLLPHRAKRASGPGHDQCRREGRRGSGESCGDHQCAADIPLAGAWQGGHELWRQDQWQVQRRHQSRGAQGTPVKAAEDGVVAYSGNELKGYGNLVLVRHSNGYVTAYAHASELMVKRGRYHQARSGHCQVGSIREVASPQLHFEIRKGSSPVDPLQFLNGA
ncbi:M23 family metallopeptidase [Bradyrhizobium japonicum]